VRLQSAASTMWRRPRDRIPTAGITVAMCSMKQQAAGSWKCRSPLQTAAASEASHQLASHTVVDACVGVLLAALSCLRSVLLLAALLLCTKPLVVGGRIFTVTDPGREGDCRSSFSCMLLTPYLLPKEPLSPTTLFPPRIFLPNLYTMSVRQLMAPTPTPYDQETQ